MSKVTWNAHVECTLINESRFHLITSPWKPACRSLGCVHLIFKVPIFSKQKDAYFTTYCTRPFVVVVFTLSVWITWSEIISIQARVRSMVVLFTHFISPKNLLAWASIMYFILFWWNMASNFKGVVRHTSTYPVVICYVYGKMLLLRLHKISASPQTTCRRLYATNKA